MSSSDTTQTALRVGLLDLDNLGDALREHGAEVFGAGSFREAAQEIMQAFALGRLPIITSDAEDEHLAGWVVQIAESEATQTVILREGDQRRIESPKSAEVQLPATLDEILTAAGLPPLPNGAGDQLYPAPAQEPAAAALPSLPGLPDAGLPGPVEEPTQADRAEDVPVDPWDEQIPEPAEPVRAPVQLDEPDDDPWGEADVSVEPVVAPVTEQVRTPELAVSSSHRSQRQPVATAPERDLMFAGSAGAAHQGAPEAFAPDRATHQGWPASSAGTDDLFGAPQNTGNAAASADDDLFSDEPPPLETSFFATPTLRNDGCPVIFTFAGRGGVGKSTFSIQLATFAAAAGLRVVLVDGNVGQGDLMAFVGLKGKPVPTITAALNGDHRASVIDHHSVEQLRSRYSKAGFALIAAPADDDPARGQVDSRTYLDSIQWARSKADLVIVDTQITENLDRTGMVDRFMVPMLAGGGWGVGVSDMSNPGIHNLTSRIKMFAETGVPANHILTVINKVPEQVLAETERRAEGPMSRISTFIGAVGEDEGVRSRMNAGETDLGSDDIQRACHEILYRITNRQEFHPDRFPGSEAGARPGRPQPAGAGWLSGGMGGLFRRLLGR